MVLIRGKLFWKCFNIGRTLFGKNSASKVYLRFLSHAHLKRPESKLVTMKPNIPLFQAVITPELSTLLEIFKKHAYEIRIAGGAVRDLLMDKQPEDVDFATTATPDQMKQMFEKEEVRMLHKKGEAHGTVTVRINNEMNFEITTLRVDMRTDGRHAEVEFTTDWELDAGRRDLTINAMFLGLDGTLYDYFEGMHDLKQKCVRFVGDPEKRIQEDYLRILRYFRFYGRIALHPDDHKIQTLEALQKNVPGLGKISGERIWMEFKKILAGNFSKEIMLRMISLGAGPFIGLPEQPNITEFEDVCNRAKGMKLHPVTKLAALLKTEDEVMALHSRLKFSNYDRDLALFIVNNRNKNGQPPLRPLYTLILDSKKKQSDTYEWSCEVLKYKGDVCLWRELSQWKIPKFPVTGHMLLQKGFGKGDRKMAIYLNKLKKLWIESDFEMTEDQLLATLDINEISDT